MKKINFENLRERNEYQIDRFLGGIQMEFTRLGKNYLIKGSNGVVVSEEEKIKLENKELILQDIKSNNCQGETTKKIKANNEKLKTINKKGTKKSGKTVTKKETVNEPIEEASEII